MHLEHEQIEKRMKEGIGFFQAADFKRSARCYSHAISLCEGISARDLVRIRVAMKMPEIPVMGELIHPRLGSLLDQRAACFEKLQQYDNALQDAQTLVRLEPLGSKGYMRAAKNLQHLQRDREAYDMLRKGVMLIGEAVGRKVKVSEKLFDTLKSQYAALGAKLRPQSGNMRTKSEEVRVISREARAKNMTVKLQTEIISARDVLQNIQDSLPRQSLRDSSQSLRSKNGKRSLGTIPRDRKKFKPRTLDPLEVFPLEVTKRILMLLRFKDILICSMLSSSWRTATKNMPELFQDIRFRNAVTFKDMAMGMQRIVQANKHSHSKSVRMVKLRPHLSDERACLNTLLNRVTINYRGLNLGLNSTSLGDLLTIIEKDKSNVQGVQRLRLICPLDTNLEWKVFELIPNLHTLELIPSRMAPEKNKPPTTEGLPASLPLRVLSLIHSGNIAAHPTIPFCNLLKTNRFPNLAAVTIVGYDFSCLRQNATSDLMFKNLPQLKHLILENNKSLNWDEFLQIFQSSGCELESLSLREDRVDGASHLRDFGSETFRPLKHLKQLDVTGSSLSFQGLMKVLRNCGSLVESLYIGHCQHIWFKNGTFNQSSTTRFFELDSVLEHAPRLRQLYLNQSSDLNNYTLKMLHPVFKEKKRELDVLDVSFNSITGIGLADLFCVSKRNEPTFRVKKLVIDACDVSLEIVKLLEGRYCDVVQYQPQKVRWKEFGVNSYVPM